MRFHFKRTRMLLGLFPIISIIFFMLTANGSLYADQVYKPIDVNSQIVATKPLPEDGTTPLDYNAQENFAIAADIISKAGYYRSVTNGEVVANVGIKYVQTVLNTKYVSGGEIFAEAQSLSSLKKVAEQKFFSGSKILYRAAAGFSGGNVSWSDKITSMAPEVFATRYGVIPREICKYNVDEASVLSGEYVGANGGEFTYRMVMRPELSTQYIKNEIRTMGGAKADPVFSSNTITFTIDSGWNIKNIVSEDSYKIELPGLGGMNCVSTLNEAFYDVNLADGKFPPAVDDFRAFVPPADGGDDDFDTPKGPSDYLAEAFADYINGKPLYLAADANVLGQKIDLRLAVDIAQMDIRGSFNGNFFAYANDNVYFDFGGNKGYVSTAALSKVTEALGADLNISLGDDILTTLFENSTIVENADSVHIIMPFELAGYHFDVDMGLKKTGTTTVADTIVAAVDLSGILPGLKIKINVSFVDGVTLPALDGFPCLDGIADFAAPVKNTVAAKAWDIGGSASIKTDAFSTALGFNALISAGDAFALKGSADVAGIRADFAYANDTAYLKAGNIKFKLAAKDIPEILGSLKIKLPELTPPDLGAAIGSIDLNGVFAFLSSLKLDVAGRTLSLKIPAGGGEAAIKLSHDAQYLTAMSVNYLADGLSVNADLTLNAVYQTEQQISVDGEGYADVKKFTAFVPAIEKLLSAQSLGLSYSFALDGTTVTGTALINLKSPLSAKLTFNAGGVAGSAVILGDNIYLKVGNAGIRARMDDFGELLALLNIELPTAELPDTGALIGGALNAISEIAFEGDALKIGIDYNGVNVRLTLAPNGGLPSATVSVGFNGTNARLDAGITQIGEQAAAIEQPDDGQYLAFADLLPFVRPVMNTAAAKSFTFGGEIDLKAEGFNEKITFSALVALQPELAAKLTLRVMGQTADVVLHSNTLYFTLGNIRIQSGLKDFEPFIAEILTLLELPPLAAPELPAMDIGGITNIIAGIKIDGLTLTLPLPMLGADCAAVLTADERGLSGLSLKGLAMGGVKADAQVSIQAHAQGAQVVPEPADYVALSELQSFIAPLKSLLTAQSFELVLPEGSMSSPFVTGNMSGRVLISAGGGFGLSAELNIFDHTVSLYFVKDTIYLQINDIKLCVSANDIAELEKQLKKYIPQLDLGAAAALPTALDEILDMGVRAVSRFELSDGRLTLGLAAFGLDLTVSAQSDLKTFSLDSLQFGDITARAKMLLTAYPEQREISAPDAASYVSLGEMLGFIDPVVNTVSQDYYSIMASGKVYALDGKLTEIKSASLKVQPTEKFIDAQMNIVLNDGKRDHTIDLTILDRSGEKINADAYAAYNGMKFTLNYHEALRILGAVKDILKLNIPILDELIKDVYVPLDTAVFDSMSIAGLDEIRDTINGLFALADDVGGSQFDQILQQLSYATVDKVLKGLKLSVEADGALKVEIKNEIFGEGNTGIASIILNKNESSLTRLEIDNLMAQTNTVSFAAALDCSPFPPIAAPADPGFNFNSINDLLVSLVDTANLGEFHIKGTVKLNIIKIISTSLNFEIKIKLVDGKPLVWARLDVPYFVAMLDETTNYLFYYGDNIYIKREQKLSESVGFLKWKDFQYNKYVKCTPAEFLANPMGYLFFMVELPGWVQNQITGAMGKGTPEGFEMKIEKVLTRYEHTANDNSGNFGLTINLAELSGNTDLGNMKIDLGTSVPAGHSKQYISTLGLSTTFVSVVDLGVTANMQSYGVDIGHIGYGMGDSKGASFATTPLNELPSVLSGWSFGSLAEPFTVRYQLN